MTDFTNNGVLGTQKIPKEHALSDSKRPSRKELSIGAYSRGGKPTENETFTILKYEKNWLRIQLLVFLRTTKRRLVPRLDQNLKNTRK